MNSMEWAILLCVGLLVGMAACLEVGYRLGILGYQRLAETSHEGVGAVETAVFGLLALLLGLAFAEGTVRLDARREFIVQEANAIGTAYLRLELLPQAERPAMRNLFRQYLDARIRIFQKLHDRKASEQELARSGQLQQEIWSRAITFSQTDPTQNVGRLLLPALNDMIDITTTRDVALTTRMPFLIYALLVGIALLSGLLVGYAMAEQKRRSWLHMVLYAAIVAFTLYVILDLDNPRAGWIRLTNADNTLVKLRDSMK
jgi:hypothetical protein